MNDDHNALAARVRSLERSLRNLRLALFGAVIIAVAAAAGGRSEPQASTADTVRARHVAIVDDAGKVRIVLGQDPKDTQRKSRSCGLTLYDASGAERFGVGTMDDGAVTMGFDAPAGVGAAMRDRIGMGVEADGSAHIMLIDNQTLVPVRMVTDAKGGGGLELIGYDLEKKTATIKRTSSAGESKQAMPLGDGK
jgi:hypothetical protein